MKILLLGKDGQVGRELRRSLAPLGNVIACGREEANLEDVETLCRLLRRETPQCIVNAAAYTAVDKAEAEPEIARRINTAAVGVLASEARNLDAQLIHYSTDYVFDGEKEQPYTETDETHPQSVYGLSKRDGEEAIRAAGCRHLILRTSWVYSAHGNNFAKTILRLGAEREEIRVVADQTGAPTGAELIAEITALCIDRLSRDRKFAATTSGTYHLAADGATTWHGYAQFVIATALQCGARLRVTPERILPITTADYPLPARRPANSRLDTGRLRNTFGVTMPPWQPPLAHMLKTLIRGQEVSR